MTVHVYVFTSTDLRLIDLTGPTLDAVSLQLPVGIYTTLRTYDQNRILGLSAHLQRLVDSLALMDKPLRLGLPVIRSVLRDVIAREGLAVARLRITLPFDRDEAYLCIEPFQVHPREFYVHGVYCVTTHLQREIPGAKRTDFIAPSRMLKAQTDPDIHEMLLVDDRGRILEGLTSNFFAVLAGKLYAADDDVLQGVTRGAVLAEAADLGEVIYDSITLDDLPQVTEAFITSSGREAMPVIQIDQQIIGTGQPGEVTKELMARYRRRCLELAERP
jgi:branched-chain amino acid aminotransferase